MSLITKEQKVEKTDFKIRMSQNVITEIDAYCNWAGIEDRNHFFSEAAKIVLAKDKEWRNYKAET